ncbi:MAG: hypothetical protein HY645_14110 [Acidobacteria bacterium]|nr:hypothetical protein [Acidobacteriota bacterium]
MGKKKGAVSGWISIKHGGYYHTLRFADHGWLAADLLQYLDEVLQAADRAVAILKLLGYTMEITRSRPLPKAAHWVEVDLEEHFVISNSDLLRKAVDRKEPAPEDPLSAFALRRIHDLLDRYDFTVRLC